MPDLVTCHRLWSETDRRVDSLRKQVAEGVGVDEASNFVRWIQFSGVLQILKSNSVDVPLRVDGYGLAAKCDELVFECGQWYRHHENSFKPRDCYIEASALSAIEARLASIEYNLLKSDVSGSGKPGLSIV